MRFAAAAFVILLVLSGSSQAAVTSTELEPRAPPWMDAGLNTALSSLWINETRAVGETPEPIDFGDRWAWAGDNAKLLSVMAHTSLIHGLEAAQMKDFILDMTHGPILFQRWVNTYEPVIVSDLAESAELSNHLLTMRLNKTSREVSLEFEYHDGRDKRMVTLGASEVFVNGTWRTPAPSETQVLVHAVEGAVEIQFLSAGELEVRETFRLDKHPGLEHIVETTDGRVTGVRSRLTSLEVISTDRVLDAGHYREAYFPDRGNRTPSQVAAGVKGPFDWFLLLDRGTTDEFANGILVRPTGPAVESLENVTLREGDAGAFRSLGIRRPDADGGIWSERLVPLVGLATDRASLYGEIAADLASERFEGLDLSLSYEYSETVLGLLHYAKANGDEGVRARAEEMLSHYLAFYPRGTQTRSLASGIMAALLLHEETGNARWLAEAQKMAQALRTYQERDKTKATFGSVLNEPKGGPFLDSTILAARAWHDLFGATGVQNYQNWSNFAWDSLAARGDRIFVTGDESDDNHWSFKSGLVLQGAPDLRTDLRWAARNHLWVTLREFETMQFRTSRYSSDTNSETEAWALLGLFNDWRHHEGPFILDSEGPVIPLSAPGEVPVRLQPPWVGAYVWVEPGWVPVNHDGIPEARLDAPHGTWRYTASSPVMTFYPSETRRLSVGWNAIGFPGLEVAVPPERLLNGFPLDIAWAIDPGTGEWTYWRPNDRESTLTELRPGQGLLAHFSREPLLEARAFEGRPAQLRDGWNLVVPPSHDLRDWWRHVTDEEDPLPPQAALAGPFAARFVGVNVTGEPPDPPMLVLARLEQDYVHRLRGGLVEARVGGEVVGQTLLGLNGSYRLVVDAPPGTSSVEIIHHDPAGPQLERVTLEYRAGAVVEPRLELFGKIPGRTPGPLLFLAILVAAFVAVVTLALIARTDLIRGGLERARKPSPPRTRK